MNSANRLVIRTTLNQCFCDFGQNRFRKLFLLEMADGDRETLIESLHEWSREGYLLILKEIDAAGNDEDCVQVLKPIEWPSS